MFSRDNLREVNLRFDFPSEEHQFLAKRIYENISLSVLKLKETEMMSVLTGIMEDIPFIQATDSERGISLSITRNSIRLGLSVERPPFVIEKREEVTKVFSEETLNGLSNDLNFLIGRVIGLFEEKGIEIKTSGNMELSRKIGSDFSLVSNFSNQLIESMKEYDVRLSGLILSLTNKSQITKFECETSKSEITVTVNFGFPYKQTISISALITAVLDEVNSFCEKLRID